MPKFKVYFRFELWIGLATNITTHSWFIGYGFGSKPNQHFPFTVHNTQQLITVTFSLCKCKNIHLNSHVCKSFDHDKPWIESLKVIFNRQSHKIPQSIYFTPEVLNRYLFGELFNSMWLMGNFKKALSKRAFYVSLATIRIIKYYK